MITPFWRRRLAFAGTGFVLASVGGPAFVASYGHAMTVADRYGPPGDGHINPWLPLTTDGLLAAVLVVVAIRRAAEEKVGWLPVTAFASGMAATIGANLAAAPIDWARPGHTIGALAVALWPPLAVMLTLELLAVALRAIARAFPADDDSAGDAGGLGSAPAEPAAPAAPAPGVVAPVQEQPPAVRAHGAGDRFDAAVAESVRLRRTGNPGYGASSLETTFGLSEWRAKEAAKQAKALHERPVRAVNQ